MNISKDKIEELKSLVNENIVDFHNHEYRGYIEDYKGYIGDVSDKLKEKQPGQMNISYPLQFMMVDTIYGTVFDFDYQIGVKNEKLQNACIDAYDFKTYGKQTLGMAAKEAIITGTGIMRDYTYYEEGEYEAFGEQIPYEIKSPTMEYVSIFNIMYDRMKGLNDSSYKIVRQFLSESDINSKVLGAIRDKDLRGKTLKTIRALKETPHAFSMYNYEAIKGLMFSTQFIDSVNNSKKATKKTYNTNVDSVTGCGGLNYNVGNGESGKTNIMSSPYYNDFNLKYEVVEIIEGKNKHVFINGEYILTQQINPNIYNLVAIEFNKIPGSGKSIGVSRIIGQIAETSNGLMNMFLDSLKLANTMIFKKNGGMPGKQGKVSLTNGQILDGDIARINLGGGDFSGMNGVQTLQTVAQTTLGINQLILGGDSRVQRIAGAFDVQIGQYKARLTPFTDSIDIAMVKIVKGWIAQYLFMYTDKELKDLYDIDITKVKGEGKLKNKTVDILIDDVSMRTILNENNISFKFDAMYNLKKDANKKLAMDIFQLAQQYNNSKIDGEAFIKLLAGDKDVKLEDVLGIQSDSDGEAISFTDDSELTDIDDIDLENLLSEVETPEQDEVIQEEETIELEEDFTSLDNNLL